MKKLLSALLILFLSTNAFAKINILAKGDFAPRINQRENIKEFTVADIGYYFDMSDITFDHFPTVGAGLEYEHPLEIIDGLAVSTSLTYWIIAEADYTVGLPLLSYAPGHIDYALELDLNAKYDITRTIYATGGVNYYSPVLEGPINLSGGYGYQIGAGYRFDDCVAFHVEYRRRMLGEVKFKTDAPLVIIHSLETDMKSETNSIVAGFVLNIF